MYPTNPNFERKIDTLKFALRMAHRMQPLAFPIMIALALVQIALPFLNLILPAAILDELNGAIDMERLQRLVLWTVALNLLLYLFERGLNQLMLYYRSRLFEESNNLISMKTIDMDYEHIENPKIHELYELVNLYRQTYGALNTTPYRLSLIIKDLFSFLLSVFFIIKLFTLPQTAYFHGPLRILDSPLSSWLLLALMVFNIFLGARINLSNERMRQTTSAAYVPDNRRFAYFSSELSNDYRFGKDIRIHNIAPLIEHEISSFHQLSFKRNRQLLNRLISGESISISNAAIISAAIYLFVALKALAGAMTIGDVLIYTGAIGQFNSALSGLTNRIVDLLQFSTQLEPMRAYLELQPVKPQGSIPVEKRDDNRYEIEFRNVSFRYPGAEEYTLRSVSMKLNIGERLAVVGMNGAGKTTFIKLLCRLYDPSEGQILLNGIDIRKYDYQEYLSIFSVVFQDFKIFAFPVGQNVAASADYEAERAMHCLDQAGVGDRVRRMPKGLETSLFKNFEEDGVEVSGGEAQKIAIARALYKAAPFIILDEPTAALDPISEFEIYSKFDSLVGSKTAVYISHRLSSCRFCHDIVVFHQGEIIQRGSHEELLRNEQGKYFEMWNAQAQYYADDTSKVGD